MVGTQDADRRIFADLYQTQDKLLRSDHGNTLLVKKIRYQVHVQDLIWRYLYIPIRHFTEWLTRQVDWLHERPIQGYLAFTFITLLILLGILI